MDAQSVIELYRTGFFVSAAVAVLGLTLAVYRPLPSALAKCEIRKGRN